MINLIQDWIRATVEALNREINLPELGVATNIDMKRKALEDLQKQEEEAIKVKEKLEKQKRI